MNYKLRKNAYIPKEPISDAAAWNMFVEAHKKSKEAKPKRTK